MLHWESPASGSSQQIKLKQTGFKLNLSHSLSCYLKKREEKWLQTLCAASFRTNSDWLDEASDHFIRTACFTMSQLASSQHSRTHNLQHPESLSPCSCLINMSEGCQHWGATGCRIKLSQFINDTMEREVLSMGTKKWNGKKKGNKRTRQRKELSSSDGWMPKKFRQSIQKKSAERILYTVIPWNNACSPAPGILTIKTKIC